ncbi:hypothetical protein V8D89_000694 [Ganoderma adspersum]
MSSASWNLRLELSLVLSPSSFKFVPDTSLSSSDTLAVDATTTGTSALPPHSRFAPDPALCEFMTAFELVFASPVPFATTYRASASANDLYLRARGVLVPRPLGEHFQAQDDFYVFAAPPRSSAKSARTSSKNKNRVAEALYEGLGLGLCARYAVYQYEGAYMRITGFISMGSEGFSDVGEEGRVRKEAFKAFLEKIYTRQR